MKDDLKKCIEKSKDQYVGIFQELNDVIAGFDQQIDRQIACNDSDFMAAYRGHMLRIQSELDRLKKKTNECEFIIKKDERVKKLEAQIAWFREEALYLANQIQLQKEEILQLREKNFCYEEDKNYLNDI